MVDCEADVTPDQDWSEDGTAAVSTKPSCGISINDSLSLLHFEKETEVTIRRVDYPAGLVVIPIGVNPPSNPATLFCRMSSGREIILRFQDWPFGAVGIFIDE
jgi:hypothetical protein